MFIITRSLIVFDLPKFQLHEVLKAFLQKIIFMFRFHLNTDTNKIKRSHLTVDVNFFCKSILYLPESNNKRRKKIFGTSNFLPSQNYYIFIILQPDIFFTRQRFLTLIGKNTKL